MARDLIVVDVEADGPCPGLYSMVCFGAVRVSDLGNTFYGETAPLPFTNYIEEALAVSGFSRAGHERFPSADTAMVDFHNWLDQFDRPVFVSDNPAFDWQWINYYFNYFDLSNPFGFSARRIGDFYAGLKGNWSDANSWKKLRTTKHTHNPVDDARGNAEALRTLLKMP